MPAETSGGAGDLIDFALPSLGSDMESGTVIEWLVGVGDQVHKGDVLLRVDTEKSDIDVEVWQDAVITEILVAPGDTVAVGTALARLAAGSPPRTVTPAAPSKVEAPKAEAPKADAPEAARPKAAPPKAAPPPVAPAARRVGEPVQPGPRLVFWPAPAGRTQPPADGPAERSDAVVTTRADRRQAAVAELMERSNREIPHFHVTRDIDLTSTLQWLETYNAAVPPTGRILPAAVFLHAAAKAAAQVSVVNGTYDSGPVDAEHVDLAVATHLRGGGLVTPVLPAAETLPLDVLMADLQAMVGRARSGRMSARDLTPPTLTVTNLGDSGADRVFGVIRPPQRALVGFGRIAERPVAVDGAAAIRPVVGVTLSADHRVVNGQAAARFLDALDELLSNPDQFTTSETDHAN